MHFTGTTVLRLKGGKIVEEIGLPAYVEIGFSLPVPTDEDPVFVLTVRTAVGFPSRRMHT